MWVCAIFDPCWIGVENSKQTNSGAQTQDFVIAAHGAKRKKQLQGDSGFEALELPAGRDVDSAALQLMLNPQVESAEPDFLISKDSVTPNDARFNEQWSLRNTGQNGGQYRSDVNAVAAWSTTTGSRATVIAVIDSGIDVTHPDLANNQWLNLEPGENDDLHGWDYVSNSAEIKDEHCLWEDFLSPVPNLEVMGLSLNFRIQEAFWELVSVL